MRLPIYVLAAAVCALKTSASPLPIADIPKTPSGLEPPSRRDSPLHNPFPEKDGFNQTGGPTGWRLSSKEKDDPLRRRDSPLSNLFPEKDGFIETGPPVRRDEDATGWFTSPPSSGGEDDDPLRRRDSPLSNPFPEKDGFIQTEAPVRRWWHPNPPSSGGGDDDPLHRRDSPLHNLPKDGIVESEEAPGPHVEVP